VSAPLPRTVRGKRPAFHEQAATDRLIAMVLALTSEVSVLRDRVATLEALTAGRDAVDAFVPDLEERKHREAEREAYLGRVLHIMREEIADIEGDETSDAYWREISDIEEGAA
jgi:predicted Ser/Thr protein kinase